MGTLTVSKPKFGTQKINAKDLKIYQEAGWSVIETPAPAVPKEVAHIAEPKAARKAKADKNAEQ
jgi:hypothetical protein